MINVSSEIRMRSEGVLERFYAMFVFRPLSGRQIDPIEPAPVPEPVPDPDLETLPKISTDPDPDQRNVWSCGAASRASTRVMDGDGVGGGGNFFFFMGEGE